MPADLPVAAPDPAEALIVQGRTFASNVRTRAARSPEGIAQMIEDLADLAAALLAERQQDKADVELALDGIPDPMHPDLRRWAYKLTDAKVLLAHVAGHDDPGNVEAARAALAVEEDA